MSGSKDRVWFGSGCDGAVNGSFVPCLCEASDLLFVVFGHGIRFSARVLMPVSGDFLFGVLPRWIDHYRLFTSAFNGARDP